MKIEALEKHLEQVLNNLELVKMNNKVKATVLAQEFLSMLPEDNAFHVKKEEVTNVSRH